MSAAQSKPDQAIEAAGKSFDLVGDFAIEAADDASKKHTFSLLAYSGGLMRVSAFFDPVVVDLGGAITMRSSQLPILHDHDHRAPIGHAEAGGVKISDAGIEITGTLSGAATPEGARVLELSRNGYRYQASIGLNPTTRERVEAGRKISVNGQEIQGPAWIVRAGELYECSLVAVGADRGSSAMVASNPPADPVDTPPAADPEAIRAAAAAESERIDSLRTLCARHRMPGVEAKAIREGWTAERAELEILRANSALSPSVGSGVGGGKGRTMDGRAELVCRGAVLCGTKPEALIAQFGEATFEASMKTPPIESLHDLMLRGAQHDPALAGIRHMNHEAIRASIGSHEISGIVTDILQSSLVASFLEPNTFWRRTSKVVPAADFRPNTRLRLATQSILSKVGTSGVIDKGQLAEADHEVQVETWGMDISLTRRQVVNDQVGAFAELPRVLRRVAMAKTNSLVADLFNASATSNFATDARGNKMTGTSSVLSVDSLATARAKLRRLSDEAGVPVDSEPRVLVVGAGNEALAYDLVEARTLVAAGGGEDDITYRANANSAGRGLMVAVSALLSDTQWHLLADPMDVESIVIAFLGGVQAPVIRYHPSTAGFDGFSWDCVLDVGAAYGDWRGLVTSVGA